MLERNISEEQLIELLETGDTRFKDDTRLWIAKALPKRTDNLVCGDRVRRFISGKDGNASF
ncbi:hypothetical protein R0J87_14290 [Halomonas sp. SIMBA_159]